MHPISRAVIYAAEKHNGQLRKGTDLPYIVHPMEVMTILSRMGADENLLIAGLLHDTVEDTDATIEEVEKLFGEAVADLVAAHTHEKRGDWWETRLHAIEFLKTAPHPVKLLILADKLSNIRSMAHDYNRIGDRLWERFSAPKHLQARYYALSIEAMADLQTDPNAAACYAELQQLYTEIFSDK